MNDPLPLPGIYKITNKINNKEYIGQSTNIRNRFAAHRAKNRRLVISKAIIKYGIANFEFDVLIYCEVSLLDEFETALIKIYNTVAPNGYNVALGGHQHKIMNESTKKKLSDARKGKKLGIENPFYGKKHTDESKKIMSQTHKGKTISDSNKRLLSELGKLRTGSLNHNYGKCGKDSKRYGLTHSIESKKLISDSRRGSKNPRSRPITINEITYCTIKEASDNTGINVNTIISRIKSNNLKYSGYSYLNKDLNNG